MSAVLKAVPEPTPDLDVVLERLRLAQARNVPDYDQRRGDLTRLRQAFKARLDEMAKVVAADFGQRSRHDSLMADGMTVLSEIDHMLKHLRRWMRPKKVHVDYRFQPGRAEIRAQPLGVVGVISPWNYPVNLALNPLAAAIAAGNHVMLKPSEHTPRTAEFLADLLTRVFPADRVQTVIGGADVAARFAELTFDHLFFTGSTQVGRLVMQSAAKNLVPVTLELGGKSPVIVAPDFPLDIAANRIAAGKLLNAGQTCIAPDYVLAPRGKGAELTERIGAYVTSSYANFSQSPDATAIVNERQHQRLLKLIDDARAHGATVTTFGDHDLSRRLLAPTVIGNATDAMAVMQEEIFGPVLPIIEVDSVDAAIGFVNARPRPLALYLFDRNSERTSRVLNETVAGGVTVNDTMLHIALADLPFGGVGPSGMGAYHGEKGFQTFSTQKSVFYQARWSGLWLFKPPYKGFADRLVKFLTR
jgi:coniferyl-aldehyde dehydrogenase